MGTSAVRTGTKPQIASKTTGNGGRCEARSSVKSMIASIIEGCIGFSSEDGQLFAWSSAGSVDTDSSRVGCVWLVDDNGMLRLIMNLVDGDVWEVLEFSIACYLFGWWNRRVFRIMKLLVVASFVYNILFGFRKMYTCPISRRGNVAKNWLFLWYR